MAKATLVSVLLSCVFRVLLGYRQQDIWNIKGYKYLIYIPVMTVIAVLGAKLSAGAAYGDASGMRMYGTILLSAAVMPVMAKLLRVKTSELYGYCSLATWLGIVFTKAACIINGCCYGIVIARHANGGIVRFPSAIVETLLAALFFVWFCILARKKKYPHEMLYPIFMVWYGIYRYAADWLRGNPIEIKPYVLWIPAGRFFSLIILVIGIAAMIFVSKKILGRKPTGKEFFGLLIGKANEDKAKISKPQ